MSEKVRIYQLARDLGMESRELLPILDEMGVEYKSHSSTIDRETADTIEALLKDTPEESTPEAVAPAETEDAPEEAAEPAEPVSETLAPRAPVVTIMGHVDHGKTSLLDAIRETGVAKREAGGITQHIGAYQAETAHGTITFLDTPGHEAFTAIRQRGAKVTDIVVIVVAADDSIMPQTREAVAHAKAAGVPIIVAINKTDLPQADPDRVKQDLMQLELVPEEFGGDTITVELSARTGDGVPQLLEMISLVAELEELKADPEAEFQGTVIESVLDRRAGVLATILVQEGTLKVGEFIVSGEQWARLRRLTDDTGAQLKAAGPSVPVQVLGFSDQPLAGDAVQGAPDEATAKQVVADRVAEREASEQDETSRTGITLADLFGKPTKKTINLLIRADTQGTLEALKGVLESESENTDEVEINIMLAEVGSPSESDLLLAGTAEASILTFGVNAPGSVKKAAERQGISLRNYRVIYDLIEDVQRMIRGQIEPEYEEQELGRAEVRQVIRVPRSGNVAGSYVLEGLMRRGARARVIRGGKEVYKGSIAGLRRFKDDVREVGTGFECGISLQNYENIQENDIIEAYEMVEVPVVL